MYRKSAVCFGALAVTLFLTSTAAAQWPSYRGDPLARGPGDYLAWYKILCCALVFIFWVRTTDWINRDSLEIGEAIGMPAMIWNPIAVFPFLVVFLFATLTIPLFAVGFPLLLVAYIAPLTTYILMRNARVTDEQKVLTPSHIRDWFKGLASGRKRKKKEILAPHEQGPPVKLTARGASTPQIDQANQLMARQSPGYVTVKELLGDALFRRVSRILLDYSKEAVAARYDIDGVWHNVEPRDRESGDVMLAVMKKLANLNMEERRARQEGDFDVSFMENKYTCHLTSQGTKTGERVIIDIIPKKSPFEQLDDLGMRDKIRDELKAALAEKQGLVIMSAMPTGGLRTTWNLALRATDRYMRDFAAIEDKTKPVTHVENVEVHTFDPQSDDQTIETLFPKVALREPDVFVLPEIDHAQVLNLVCKQVNEEGRLAVIGVRAKDSAEALLRVLAVKPDVEQFAQAVTCVLNQRLVRRLCETCRQAYEPPADLLQKLGIPPGRVQVLFREYQPPPPGQKRPKGEPEICPDCGGLGYKGRVAVYELTKVDDRLRQGLLGQPQLETIRKLARQSGNRTLQEEGILLVARGITSLTELQRVLKQ
jgi:type II secretory ATPase GspE/PulE/Tfp pilus assembly ATPase PilB-like protein